MGQQALCISLAVAGFSPCDLLTSGGSASCTEADARQPQARLRLPYGVLAGVRMGRWSVVGAIVGGLLAGRVRVSGLGLHLWRVARTDASIQPAVDRGPEVHL